MSLGAENIDPDTNPLLASLSFGLTYAPDGTYTYAFAPAGTAVEDGGYSGGSETTRAWTAQEQQSFRDVAARFMEVADMTFTEVASTASPDLELQMVDDVPGGWAGYASIGGGFMVVGDDGRSLLTHELGHSAYLDHPFDGTTLPGVSDTFDPGSYGLNSNYYTVMAYRGGEPYGYDGLDMPAHQSLAAIDIAMLQALYGANQTHASGDDGYDGMSAFETIWDAGGNDTLDFSDALQDSVVDLRAATLQVEEGGGGFVSLFNYRDTSGTDTAQGGYTIAYGVTIENGFSGRGNDTLTGNDADNLLRARVGDDSAFGGAGDDTIDGAEAGVTLDSLTVAELNGPTTSGRVLEVDEFTLPTDFTLDMVLRIDAGVSAAQTVFQFLADTSTDPRLELRLWDDSNPWLWAALPDDSGGTTFAWTGIGKDELADGALHRLSLTRETATGALNFYLDGVHKNSATYRPGEALAADSLMTFGRAGNGLYEMQGDFGPIALYDRVLDGVELAEPQIHDMADPSDPDLAHFWVPGGSTTTIADTVGATDLTASGGTDLLTLQLNSDNDTLEGGDGNDVIMGRIGSDTLRGGNGNDSLHGGADDDAVNGNLHEDSLDGGSGNDTLRGNNGFDTLEGGNGDDRLFGGRGGDLIDGGDGNDLLDGAAYNDTMNGGTGNDTLEGGGGHDLLRGQNGADSMIGGAHDDTLNGGAGDDTLIGQTGDDVLNGNGTDDLLDGGDGNDTLEGGTGRDTLIGGTGDDVLNPNSGLDTLVFNPGDGNDTVNGFDAADGEDIDLSAIAGITDFADLVADHLSDSGGDALITYGANSILLAGVAFGSVGAGLAYDDGDFIF